MAKPTGDKPKVAPPAPLRRPATLDHLRGKKPREHVVPIVVDDEAAQAYEDAQAALLAAAGPDVEAAGVALGAARQALEEATVHVRVRALGRKAYENLQRAHPPTPVQEAEIQKKDADATLAWNPDTFPAALVAACMIEPTVSIAEAAELLDTWNVEESSRLFYACEMVNQRARADLGKGYGPTGG